MHTLKRRLSNTGLDQNQLRKQEMFIPLINKENVKKKKLGNSVRKVTPARLEKGKDDER